MKRKYLAIIAAMMFAASASSETLTSNNPEVNTNMNVEFVLQKKKSAPAAKISEAAFFKKWGAYYENFEGGIADYGWPKLFFTQMMQALPKQFKMKYVGKENGITYYSFAFIRDSSSVNVGAIGFSGSKLYSFDVNGWGLTDEYLEQLIQQLDWKELM